MTASFGSDWRTQFLSFEDRPFAAASIGQVSGRCVTFWNARPIFTNPFIRLYIVQSFLLL